MGNRVSTPCCAPFKIPSPYLQPGGSTSPLSDFTDVSAVLIRTAKLRSGGSYFKALTAQRKADCTWGKKELKIWS